VKRGDLMHRAVLMGATVVVAVAHRDKGIHENG
jgi:hypothetical protein